MQIRTALERGAHVLTLSGDLDVASTGTLEEALGALDASTTVVIDLQALAFVDSTGLGLLVKAHQRQLHAGGRLVLVNGTGPVARLLDISGVGGHLEIVDSLEQALALGR